MTPRRTPRIVLGMIDGFGLPYWDATPLPVLHGMASEGLFKRTQCVFPSVTNVNNVSIATASWPREHGITANSYFDERAGAPAYMNAGELIRARTLFEWAREQGLRTALITAKRKSVELFSRFADLAVTAEQPPESFLMRFGRPAGIYSPEINYWLWEVAAGLLQEHPDIDFYYVHTTDYPMHRFAPETRESQEHLQQLDRLIGRCREVAPDAAFLITADHSMNAKTRNWDLKRVCEQAGTPIRFALSPERDYYLAHHKNYTGCSWLWLENPGDEAKVRDTLAHVEGIDAVLTREECAARYHTIPERVGDLNVMGDVTTMFGDAEDAYDVLRDYRAHGSLHEMDVPLLIHNLPGPLPDPAGLEANKDLARVLLRPHSKRLGARSEPEASVV
jgi:phosphonoacetate hydrolase